MNTDLQIRPRQKGQGDIVFIIDVTSSMTPCIDGLKESVLAFTNELENEMKKNEIQSYSFRFAMVKFKDLDVDKDPIEIHDFGAENDIEYLKNLLNGIKIEPYVGGDPAESVYEALYVAKNISWREAGRVHRIAILFTDNPPKAKFNATVLKSLNLLEEGDDVLETFPINEVVNLLGQSYREKRIKTFCVVPDTTKNDFTFFDNFYNHLGIYIPSYKNEGLKGADFSGIYKLLAKTISE